MATINAIRYCSAIPTFIDIDLQNLSLDVEKLKGFIEKDCKYKNGVLINKNTPKTEKFLQSLWLMFLGNIGNQKEVFDICKKYKKINLIIDAAESIGAKRYGYSSGHFQT